MTLLNVAINQMLLDSIRTKMQLRGDDIPLIDENKKLTLSFTVNKILFPIMVLVDLQRIKSLHW